MLFYNQTGNYNIYL